MVEDQKLIEIEDKIDYILEDKEVKTCIGNFITKEYMHISDLRESDSYFVNFVNLVNDFVNLVNKRVFEKVECSKCELTTNINKILAYYNKKNGTC